MFDTLTVVAYLISHHSGYADRLRFMKPFSNTENQLCIHNTQSPALKWRGVPPEASSLALIVKDKMHYEWIVYNLPVSARGLPFGANHQMTPHDQGVNSWGEKNYHAPCFENKTYLVSVTLYALDKRFSARENMTGNVLEKKMKGHVLTKVVEKTLL
ncbi:MAG: hypothetical protein A3F13_09250 [Gammaproteobacteria bacterium RIFCSPHIGHO2_12_FULL_40_19]|nr:MAG: hypothetical protein A3F13_09250 [Gammaproteobacteria bacterium RIFCSPHIGHO2_12_FULL_40_19]